jgi:hypothetical protein
VPGVEKRPEGKGYLQRITPRCLRKYIKVSTLPGASTGGYTGKRLPVPSKLWRGGIEDLNAGRTFGPYLPDAGELAHGGDPASQQQVAQYYPNGMQQQQRTSRDVKEHEEHHRNGPYRCTDRNEGSPARNRIHPSHRQAPQHQARYQGSL